MSNSGFAQFIPLILIFVIFYFFLIRPQQKKHKEHKLMVENLKRGDKVYAEENGNVGGAEGVAAVPKGQEDAVIESAEECPGECIMIEPDWFL